MSILPIYRQPIQMAPFDEKDYACERPSPFCSLFKQGDIMRVQLKQTPCGSNLMCNQDFDLTYLVNEKFTTDPTGTWSLFEDAPNNTITWDSTNKRINFSGTGQGNIYLTPVGMTPGNIYKVSWTISTANSEFYGKTELGGTLGATQVINDTTQTFTEYLVAGAIDYLSVIMGTSLDDAQGWIDDVSVSYVGCWVGDTDITFSNGVACHTPGSSSNLYAEIFGSLSPGDYVEVSYEIFGMTAGQVEVYVAGTLSRTVTQNGSYTDYITTAVTDIKLQFSFDADFNGCVVLGDCYRLQNIGDIQGGTSIVDVNGNLIDSPLEVHLNEDRINLIYNTADLAEGCYRLRITDPCGLVSDLPFSEVNADVPFDDATIDASVWTIHNTNGMTQVAVSVLEDFIAETTPPITSSNDWVSQNFTFTPGFYAIKVNLTVGNVWPSGMQLKLVLPTGATATEYTVIPEGASALTNYTTFLFVNILNQTVSTYQSVNIHNKFGLAFVGDKPSGYSDDGYEVNRLSFGIYAISEDAVSDYILESNCLQVVSDVGDALLVRGVNDQNHSLGFVFDSFFPYIESRLFLSFVNPHNPTDQNGYLYSSGLKKKTFAQLDKLYDLQVHEVDENMHDVFHAILCSDHSYIGINSAKFREYMWLEKSYEPNWPKKAATGTAEATVEIGRISATVFN